MSERKVDVFCTYCGAKVPENTSYCLNCKNLIATRQIEETGFGNVPIGMRIPRRGLMEKDLLIIIFIIFLLTLSVAIFFIWLIISRP